MIGPTPWNRLSTKQDFANNMAEYPKEGLEAYRMLYENRFNWLPVTDSEGNYVTYSSESEGITDETHKLAMASENEFLQLEWRVDPNALMFLKGFTEIELETILRSYNT